MKNHALILANGIAPSKRLLKSLLADVEFFVCADGGCNAAARMNLRPDLIIGDLDSVGKEAIRKFAHVQARRIAEQNSTDLEKAIAWLVRRDYDHIVVVGALGGRTDHLLGNLSALAKFSRAATIRFVDEDTEITYVGSEYSFYGTLGSTVSLLPLSLCQGITTRGLRWELKNEVLELGFRESTSNSVRSSLVTIKVKKGDLLLCRVNVTKKPISMASRRRRSSSPRRSK